VIGMDYQLSLSPCSRYVYFRAGNLAVTVEQVVARLALIADFAARNGTCRVMIDWRDKSLFPALNLYEAWLRIRNVLKGGPWRFAMLYSVESSSYSIDMITGFSEVLAAIGQHGEHFVDLKEAEAWLVSDEAFCPH
jgi:hypothetical protein